MKRLRVGDRRRLCPQRDPTGQAHRHLSHARRRAKHVHDSAGVLDTSRRGQIDRHAGHAGGQRRDLESAHPLFPPIGGSLDSRRQAHDARGADCGALGHEPGEVRVGGGQVDAHPLARAFEVRAQPAAEPLQACIDTRRHRVRADGRLDVPKGHGVVTRVLHTNRAADNKLVEGPRRLEPYLGGAGRGAEAQRGKIRQTTLDAGVDASISGVHCSAKLERIARPLTRGDDDAGFTRGATAREIGGHTREPAGGQPGDVPRHVEGGRADRARQLCGCHRRAGNDVPGGRHEAELRQGLRQRLQVRVVRREGAGERRCQRCGGVHAATDARGERQRAGGQVRDQLPVAVLDPRCQASAYPEPIARRGARGQHGASGQTPAAEVGAAATYRGRTGGASRRLQTRLRRERAGKHADVQPVPRQVEQAVARRERRLAAKLYRAAGQLAVQARHPQPVGIDGQVTVKADRLEPPPRQRVAAHANRRLGRGRRARDGSADGDAARRHLCIGRPSSQPLQLAGTRHGELQTRIADQNAHRPGGLERGVARRHAQRIEPHGSAVEAHAALHAVDGRGGVAPPNRALAEPDRAASGREVERAAQQCQAGGRWSVGHVDVQSTYLNSADLQRRGLAASV